MMNFGTMGRAFLHPNNKSISTTSPTFLALCFSSSSSLLLLCDLTVQAFVTARYPGTGSRYRVLFLATSQYKILFFTTSWYMVLFFATSRYRVFFFFLFWLLFVCLFVSSPFLFLCKCMLPKWSLQGGSCLQGAQGGDFQSVRARKVLRAPKVPIL